MSSETLTQLANLYGIVALVTAPCAMGLAEVAEHSKMRVVVFGLLLGLFWPIFWMAVVAALFQGED